VLDIVVQAVNLNRARPVTRPVFRELLKEDGTEHTVLMLHAQVRLLGVKVLARILELRDLIGMFLREMGQICINVS
jgi:hypothetical protein